jgi:Ca2+-transporting ATPase
VRSIVWYALLITLVTLGAMGIALGQPGSSTERARTIAFVTLALAQAFHLGTARSTGHVFGRQVFTNPFALGAVLLVVALQTATVHYAPLARALHTTALTPLDWLMVTALAIIPGLAGQVMHGLKRYSQG